MYDDFDTQICPEEIQWYGYDEFYQEWPEDPDSSID